MEHQQDPIRVQDPNCQEQTPNHDWDPEYRSHTDAPCVGSFGPSSRPKSPALAAQMDADSEHRGGEISQPRSWNRDSIIWVAVKKLNLSYEYMDVY